MNNLLGTYTYLGAAFPFHPYGRAGIGPMSDLFNLRRTDAVAFFRANYAPNRAALVLVGDFKLETILPTVEAYFGKIPRQADPLPMHTVDPEQRGERRVAVEKDMTPFVRIGWQVPAQGHPDVPALNVLADLMAKGRTSRLYKALVEGAELTTDINAGYGDPGEKYPTLLETFATVKGDHTAQELENAIHAEVEKLQKEPPTAAELARVQRNAEMDLMRKLENPSGLADTLAQAWVVTGDENTFVQNLDRLKAVTPEDVQRVAKTYLVPQHRVVATLVRPANAGPKDPLDAELEALLTKAIGAQVKDAAKAKQILDAQMAQLKALPKAKKEEILKQIKAQMGQ